VTRVAHVWPQDMRLQARQLRTLDITGCAALRTLQVAGLERPVGQIQEHARSSKVGTRACMTSGCTAVAFTRDAQWHGDNAR
jgi:hypothetical protein